MGAALALPDAQRQATAWRLAQAHYHAIAASLLARAAGCASQQDRDRAIAIARLYAALLIEGGREGERALERAALEEGAAILGV